MLHEGELVQMKQYSIWLEDIMKRAKNMMSEKGEVDEEIG